MAETQKEKKRWKAINDPDYGPSVIEPDRLVRWAFAGKERPYYLAFKLSSMHEARMIANALNSHAALLEACKAVVGEGYCEVTSAFASQDYVPKSAIAKVRAALREAEDDKG